jgi:hypothetical protein
VFEAFATVVKRKTERYYRIAGLDPQNLAAAALNDALIKAVAQEASDIAGQFLSICIRAIDYCPPTDLELGEYLRVITADPTSSSDKWASRGPDAILPPARDLSAPRPVHDRDAVRWQPLETAIRIPARLPALKFDGDRAARRRGRVGCVRRTPRQLRHDPRHADVFRLVSPGAPLPKGGPRRRRRRCNRSASHAAPRRTGA